MVNVSNAQDVRRNSTVLRDRATTESCLHFVADQRYRRGPHEGRSTLREVGRSDLVSVDARVRTYALEYNGHERELVPLVSGLCFRRGSEVFYGGATF